MPQITAPTREDSGRVYLEYSGTATTTNQNFTFSSEQNGMTFRNKSAVAMTLTVDGVKHNVPPYATIEIDDNSFSSFDVKSATGSQKFEIKSFLIKNSVAGLADVRAQLADTTSLTGSVVSAYWKPPTQPPARTDEPGYIIDGFTKFADDHLNLLWEPLRQANSDYITRTLLGKDQSGTYDIYRYDFTPDNYEKTIIVTGNLHGGENMSMIAFYLFMKQVCDNWKEYPQLAYLRNKVRIISIPISNPWGLSQVPRKRQNATGVDLNRNFDYKWSTYPTGQPFDHDYKGTAPFSEVESQYIRDLLAQYPDAIAFIDLHALGSGKTEKAYIYTPKAIDNGQEVLWRNFLDWYVPNGDTHSWQMTTNPTGYHYAAETYGMYSSNPEWPTAAWGTTLGSIEMTKAVEYYGNIILQHAVLKLNAKLESKAEPFVHFYNYLGTTAQSINVTSTAYADINEFTVEFDVPMSGIIMFDGNITCRNSDAAGINYFMPAIGQVGGLYEPGTNLGDYYESYYNSADRMIVPITGVLPVKPTSSAGFGKAKFILRAKVTAGTLSIYRYHLKLSYIPSSKADSVKIYSAKGKEGQGVGAMTLLVDGFK